ncbi:MAG: hypothetical protein F4222_04335 [Gammaproteobacteria bacterium]|nr:hypothetical protein [Gammaproteobacteria bacterium]MYH34080.1 hypothetical protein [Gammaproteobacteria bacterium]
MPLWFALRAGLARDSAKRLRSPTRSSNLSSASPRTCAQVGTLLSGNHRQCQIETVFGRAFEKLGGHVADAELSEFIMRTFRATSMLASRMRNEMLEAGKKDELDALVADARRVQQKIQCHMSE